MSLFFVLGTILALFPLWLHFVFVDNWRCVVLSNFYGLIIVLNFLLKSRFSLGLFQTITVSGTI